MDKETLKLLSDLLDEKLEPIKVELNEHSVILKEHSVILNDHSAILKEHSAILNEHSAILNEHSVILKEHTEVLNNHSQKFDEHKQILRALEHLAQVNKAEHDSMANDIAHIKGDVEGIKRDLTSVELITANNWADIVKLKSIKQ